MADNTIIIIGAGFAGLSAGIYAQMNGYQTQIYEMHDQPGGLCTAWKRKGYTIDACIHWLVGSSPRSAMHEYWQEVGIIQGREFVNLDEYARYETADGRTVIFYTDVDRLEKHLLEFSPQDAEVTREFIKGIRMCLPLDQAPEKGSRLGRFFKSLQLGLMFATRGKAIQQWMSTSTRDFAKRIKDPVLRDALEEIWFPDFSLFFMIFTLAYLHNQNAGYPIGGSMPMSKALEQRYLDLGGTIHYKSRVEKILLEADKAVGIRLADGSEHTASRVISAADGYSTIFKMLDGKYADEKVRQPYESWPIFPPLIFIGLGINRTFDEVPKTVSGFSFPLKQPTEIGDSVRERLPVRIANHDATLAPSGKTCMTIMLPSSHSYWQELVKDRVAYDEKKDQVARTVVSLLEQRFPGISNQVEMVDVATPLTFERYTGNWQGSFEGWLITPSNAQVVMKPMSQTLPGLSNFFMCGQWVEPGGGLPTGVMSGRRLIRSLCKDDGKQFKTLLT